MLIPEQTSLGAYIKRFFPNMEFAPHHRRLIRILKQVEEGTKTRVIVSIPPRHGKSNIISDHFPAWAIGRNPDMQIAAASYGQSLSEKAGRKIQGQITSDHYKAIFQDLDVAKASQREITSKQGGVYLATSVGGQLTGSGAHILIIDDPHKDRQEAESELMRERAWEWYTSTARTRVMPYGGKPGRIVVVLTRWHENDLAGRLMENDPDGEWEYIRMPALDEDNNPLWPERFDLDTLLSIKRDVGNYEWQALYQNDPRPADGNVLPVKSIRYYDEEPEFSRVIQIWDTAIKEGKENDWSVCTTLGMSGQNIYEIDQFRKKMAYPELKRMVALNYNKHRPSLIVIEDKSSGQQLIQELSASYPIKAVGAVTDKVERAGTLADCMSVGRIYLKKDEERNNTTVSEMAGFPSVKHDDIVDTFAYGARELVRAEILPLIGDHWKDDFIIDYEGNIPRMWRRFRSMCYTPMGKASVIWWSVSDERFPFITTWSTGIIYVHAEKIFDPGITSSEMGSLIVQTERAMGWADVDPGPAGSTGDIELWSKVGPSPITEFNKVGAKFVQATEDEPGGWNQVRQRLFHNEIAIHKRCESLIEQMKYAVADPKNKERSEPGQHISSLFSLMFVCNAFKRKTKKVNTKKVKPWRIK